MPCACPCTDDILIRLGLGVLDSIGQPAAVTQLVEYQHPKLTVAGSIPITRSSSKFDKKHWGHWLLGLRRLTLDLHTDLRTQKWRASARDN
jgi:hypothetical protein